MNAAENAGERTEDEKCRADFPFFLEACGIPLQKPEDDRHLFPASSEPFPVRLRHSVAVACRHRRIFHASGTEEKLSPHSPGMGARSAVSPFGSFRKPGKRPFTGRPPFQTPGASCRQPPCFSPFHPSFQQRQTVFRCPLQGRRRDSQRMIYTCRRLCHSGGQRL